MQKPTNDYARIVRLEGVLPADARERALHALGMEGFRVVAEIDFQDSLQRNLDKDIGPYRLLEVCRPDLADRALAVDRSAGLLIPCKVGIWREGPDAVIAALRPEIVAAAAGDERLFTVTLEAQAHLDRAIDRLLERQYRAA